MNKIIKFFKLKDYTNKYNSTLDNDDIRYSALCYIGPLFIIAMLNKKNDYTTFHINQGLNLFLLELLIFCILFIFNKIFSFVIGYTPVFLSIINFFSYLLLVLLMLFGIINSINLKSIELPLIGKYRFIK